jgi:quercetin dioxygenase-like cupin family protein
LAADFLNFDLGSEMRTVRAELDGRHARIARTLVKEGALRLTLVGLAPGGALHAHRTDSPVTIHVLEGQITLDIGDVSHAMAAGQLAALEAGVPHAVRAGAGAFILLTVAAGHVAADSSADTQGP